MRINHRIELRCGTPVPSSLSASHDDDFLHLLLDEVGEEGNEEGDVGESAGRDDGELLAGRKGGSSIGEGEDGALPCRLCNLSEHVGVVVGEETFDASETVDAVNLCKLGERFLGEAEWKVRGG